MKRKTPTPSSTATTPDRLIMTSSQRQSYLDLLREGNEQKLAKFRADHNSPVGDDNKGNGQTDMTTTATNATTTLDDLGKQLENQEEQLISFVDSLGSLDEKLYELREAVSKLPTRTMMEALSEKLDEVLEQIKLGGGHHEEWPGGGAGWND